MAEAGAGGPTLTVATVYFCPEGERVGMATPSANFRLAADTTFFEILQGACTYYEQNIADMVLRNAGGSIWPMKDRVANGLRYGGEIRLTPNDKGDEQDKAQIEEVVEEVEKDDVDDGRVVAARPPLVRELILHMLFLAILITDTYLVNTKPVFRTHKALEAAFIQPQNSRDPLITDPRGGHHQEAVNDFHSIFTTPQMCTWLTERRIDGRFDTDLRDAWGNVEVFNRVAGGITIESSFQAWQNDTEAKRARRPYDPFVGGFPDLSIAEIRQPPAQIPLFDNTSLSQNITIIFEQELRRLTDGVCVFVPADGGGRQHTVMRALQVTILFHNHNYDLFFASTFLFDMKLSGQVRPYYAFRAFRLEPSWGSWIFEARTGQVQFWRRLRFYLGIINYVLVFLRSDSERRAMLKVVRETGSVRPYLSGVFTLLELFNLTCNYIGLIFRIYEQFFLPQRIELERLLHEGRPHEILETSVDMVVVVTGILLTARALSIISAMLLLFKYLELAPRRYLSSYYLTGTTLARAGRHLQVVLLFFLVVLFAFSVIGAEIFGSTLREFSSVPNAFFTLCICVAGSGFIYRPLTAHFPVLGPLFFVVFTLTHLLVITPLFLATLNDAYAVRDEQMRQAAERRTAREEERRKARDDRLRMLKKA